MFKIPSQLIEHVRPGETFHVTKVGNGIAFACGDKAVIEIPSVGIKLGERFFATGTHWLVKRLTLENSVSPDKATSIIYKGRKIQ